MPGSAAEERDCPFLEPLLCSGATPAMARAFRGKYFTTQPIWYVVRFGPVLSQTGELINAAALSAQKESLSAVVHPPDACVGGQ